MFEYCEELIEISEYVSLDELISNGFDVLEADSYGNYVLEPICEALMVKLVEQLIKAGADVNSRSDDEITPLLSVIECSHHDPEKALAIVKLLLDGGADIEARGEWDKTPFLKSCTRGVIEVTRLLVERGCNVNATADELGGPMGAEEFADMPGSTKEFRKYIGELINS